MKKRDLVKHLRQNGCILHSHGAKHDKYINTANGKLSTVPRHREIKSFLCVHICKQLEIPIVKGK